MAEYHNARKEWAQVVQCCEEGLGLLSSLIDDILDIGTAEEVFLLLLADAAEAQGEMKRAEEYDEKVKAVWHEKKKGKGECELLGFVSCHRRIALKHLAAGEPHMAIKILEMVPAKYLTLLESTGINLAQVFMLEPLMAALKVLADALVQTEIEGNGVTAGKIRADVEETESIVAGYYYAVLQETRWELGEQRRAAATLAGGTMQKRKAAKRKQQKRKAQQQKKAAEMAEAAAAAAVARGKEVAQGLDGIGTGSRQEERGEEKAQAQESQEGNDDEQSVLVATAALAAMAMGGTKGQAQGEEEEEDECSVCLNAIDSDEGDNPAGLPLPCGHCYHAFCLHFWVERCMSKCIEATCPYCRAPLQEMGST